MILSLSTLTYAAASAIAILHIPCLLFPGRGRDWIQRFPRSRTMGWLLTAVDIVWVGLLLYAMHLGRFDKFKPALIILAPFAFYLIITFLDELLAPRAFGGLLLLLPAPIILPARLHESPLALVMMILAYLCVVVGMVLVVSPHCFRKTLTFWIATNTRMRAAALTGTLLSMFLIYLGWQVA